MRRQAEGNKSASTPEDNPDLSQADLTKSPRASTEFLHPFLLDIQHKWQESQQEFEQQGDIEGADLAKKVQTLCRVLIDLTYPISINESQRRLINEMIVCLAGEGVLLSLQHPGNAARAVLPIATYLLNSSQGE